MNKNIKRLEKHGYNVTHCLSGCIIDTKNGRTYKADTITGLIRLIFKPI